MTFQNSREHVHVHERERERERERREGGRDMKYTCTLLFKNEVKNIKSTQYL